MSFRLTKVTLKIVDIAPLKKMEVWLAWLINKYPFLLIIQRSVGLPDVHSGYGFAIGKVFVNNTYACTCTS